MGALGGKEPIEFLEGVKNVWGSCDPYQILSNNVGARQRIALFLILRIKGSIDG